MDSLARFTISHARFAGLPEYPFAPNYVFVDGLRMHYVEAGGANDPVILLLHGEPSWSFLYRKMIPILAAAGYRVIAPDLIGFGRSDKPIDRNDYTHQKHVDWVTELIETLDLNGITPQNADIAVVWPDASEKVLASAFEVTEGIGPKLVASLEGLQLLRPNRTYTVWLQYSNEGDADLAAPLFVVGNPQGVSVRYSAQDEFTTPMRSSSSASAPIAPWAFCHRARPTPRPSRSGQATPTAP